MRGPFIRVGGHTLYEPGLRDGACVVDLGANRGSFRRQLSGRIRDATFHAVEANPALLEALNRQGYASVQGCAVTAGHERVRLQVAQNDEASSILTLPESSPLGAVSVGAVEVDGRSMEEILCEIPGFIDVVKVDIEGAEAGALQTLTAPTLARVGQLSVEFHRDTIFGFDLAGETRAAIRHLERGGFVGLSFWANDMDVLLLNRSRFGVPRATALRWKWSLRSQHRLAATRVEFGRRRIAARRALVASVGRVRRP